MGPFLYECNICHQTYRLSCALLIHKVTNHLSDACNEPKIAEYLPELVRYESISSADSDYDYVIVVQTSVTQTPKIKLESVYTEDFGPRDEDAPSSSPHSVKDQLISQDVPVQRNIRSRRKQTDESRPPRIYRGRSKKTIARLADASLDVNTPPISTTLLTATTDGGCQCNICGQPQSDRPNAYVHIFTEHRELVRRIDVSDAATFVCDMCPKVFRQFVYYKNHQRYLHLNGRLAKNHLCNTCGKRFQSNHYLTVHELKHTNAQRPFECDMDHSRVHTNERPFECRFCHRRFRLQGTHRAHVRIHTGERPYKCTICNKGFIKAFGLSQHLKTKQRCGPGGPMPHES